MAAMRNGIFGAFFDFGKGPVGEGVGDEYRVVPEASAASRFVCDAAFAGAFE